jgi:hypothetical protein
MLHLCVPTEDRARSVVDAATIIPSTDSGVFDHETELRTMLRLSLNPERENERSRRGPTNTNRDRWIGALLQGLPDDVAPDARDRLADALIPLFAADAVVWTTDMAQLPRDQAIELLAWMAQALITATLHRW